MSPEPDRHEDEHRPALERLPAVRPANGAEAQNLGHATGPKVHRARELRAVSVCSARIVFYRKGTARDNRPLRPGGWNEGCSEPVDRIVPVGAIEEEQLHLLATHSPCDVGECASLVQKLHSRAHRVWPHPLPHLFPHLLPRLDDDFFR
jgi:hypothetical protein